MPVTDVTDPDLLAQLNGDAGSRADGGGDEASLVGHGKAAVRGLANYGIGTVGGLGSIYKAAGDAAEGLGLKREHGRTFLETMLPALGPLAPLAVPPLARGIPSIGLPPAPTTEEVKKKVEEYTGPLYEPKGAEKYTATAAEFAPNLIGGGGLAAWGRRGAETLGSALSSEYAGQTAQQYLPGAETPARILAAIFGGMPAGRAAAMYNSSVRNRTTPHNADLERAADFGYGGARDLNPPYEAVKVHNMQRTIAHDLKSDGYGDDVAGKTFKRVESLLGQPPNVVSPTGPSLAANPTYSEIESVRKGLVRIAKEGRDPKTGTRTEDASAALRAIGHIDDFLENPANAVAGHEHSAALAARFSEYGRRNWAALEHSRELDLAIQKGDWGAAVSGSGANIDNRLRQQVRNILANPTRANRYSPQQRAIMEDIVEGSSMRNSARLIGKMAVTGAVPGAALLYLGHRLGLGWAGEAALAGIAYGAKKSGDYWTRREMRALSQAIRADSPLGQLRGIPDYVSPYSRAQATSALYPFMHNAGTPSGTGTP